MFPPRATELAHLLLRPFIMPGDTVVDATAGNGHDTVFLAERTGPAGRVVAFDIQADAIACARSSLARAGLTNVTFHQESHRDLARHLAPRSVSAIMFNLGYWPGNDHAVTTTADETRAALDAATVVLRPGGAVSIVCYPGHPAGATEADAVESWFANQQPDHWRLAKYQALATRQPAPYCLIASWRGP